MKISVLFLALSGFAVFSTWQVRGDDYSELKNWFAKPETTRGSVPATVNGTLKNAAGVKAASERTWQAYKAGAIALGWETNLPSLPQTLEASKALPAEQRPKASLGALWEAGKEMPFYLLAKGARGSNGWPTYFALHGGGMDPNATGPHTARFNDSEWAAQVRFFETIYPSGLYFIPRMAEDRDGRWWYSYCQAIYDRAIRSAILFRGADPNRIYVMGISEGGYAGYRLGAHMADRWAASCAMAAAEPMDTSPPENFRNLPFRCGIGELDSMFSRNILARNYFAKLAELKTADGDASAYVNFFDQQKGRGHGIDYKPGPLWIEQFVRNPWPGRIVWTVQPLHGVVRHQAYWLALDSVPEKTPLYLTARVENNIVNLTAEQNAGENQRVAAANLTMRVYLNDTLANLDQPVRILVNGKPVFAGKLNAPCPRWRAPSASAAIRISCFRRRFR